MSQRELLEREKKNLEPEAREAREIVQRAKAAGRGLTTEEQGRVDAYLAKSRDLNFGLDRLAVDDEIRRQAKALASEVGNPFATGAESSAKDNGKRLSFKGMGQRLATTVLGPDGSKALAPSGATVVGQEFEADPIALGQVATGLLDVLPVKQHASPEFSYMLQGTRTNNAAVVAEGTLKPTSPLGLVKVDTSLSVVAHLSEGVPRYWLLDTDSLMQFVDNELRYGLGLAVEAKVIADINATSGIQTQLFSTSVLETLRKSLTKLEIAGLEPSSIVMHPSDFEGVELALTSTTAVERQSLPFDAVTRRLFGTPVVVTTSETVGTAHVLARDAVVLDTDMIGIGVQWSENATADSFAKNLTFARCEGRFATSVRSLLGVVTAALTV